MNRRSGVCRVAVLHNRKFHEQQNAIRRRTAVLLGALIVILAPLPISSQTPAVPAEPKPPDGAKLVLQALARGEQIYTCKEQSGQYSWTLKAPEAQLSDQDGKPLGRHIAGPTWELNDKSAVTGKAIKRVESPDKDAIPWLLVGVVDHSGNGLLTSVTHIQRLDTVGGKAPATGCDAPHAGQEVRASYSAKYLFYESAPAQTAAQSAFDGTWKADMGSAKFPDKPDEYLLKDGTYQCKSCVPPINIKADGQDQRVSGYPYFDTMSVRVADDRTVEYTNKKNGKTVGTGRSSVSADGNSLSFEFTDSSATNADPVTGKGSSTRVSKGPAGAHAISGSWHVEKMESVSENGLIITFKTVGDSLTMSTPTGQGYTAKMDGTEAPYKGDPGTTSVSVKKTGPNSFEETDKREGKVISVTRMTVSADGKSMKVVNDDKLHGTQNEITLEKQ